MGQCVEKVLLNQPVQDGDCIKCKQLELFESVGEVGNRGLWV